MRAQERVRLARFEVTEGTRENRCARTTNASDSCFTGKEEDIDVGLTYFGKRYLSPYLNRWISPDPLAVHGLGADLNLYAYVSGRALKAVDPLGLQEAPKDSIPDGWSFTVTGCGQEGVACQAGDDVAGAPGSTGASSTGGEAPGVAAAHGAATGFLGSVTPNGDNATASVADTVNKNASPNERRGFGVGLMAGAAAGAGTSTYVTYRWLLYLAGEAGGGGSGPAAGAVVSTYLMAGLLSMYVEYLALGQAGRNAEVGYKMSRTSSKSATSTASRGGANPKTQKAAARGSKLHSDKPGHLPDQLRARYPNTDFEFTKPGVAGQDVHVTGGQHPSSYTGSKWPQGVDYADFKPDTPGGRKTFSRDQRLKWKQPTFMLPYDPRSGTLTP